MYLFFINIATVQAVYKQNFQIFELLQLLFKKERKKV